MNLPRPKNPQEYARELERVLAQCLQPLKNIPFKAAIRAVASCTVLDFDSNTASHEELALKVKAAAIAAEKKFMPKGFSPPDPMRPEMRSNLL